MSRREDTCELLNVGLKRSALNAVSLAAVCFVCTGVRRVHSAVSPARGWQQWAACATHQKLDPTDGVLYSSCLRSTALAARVQQSAGRTVLSVTGPVATDSQHRSNGQLPLWRSSDVIAMRSTWPLHFVGASAHGAHTADARLRRLLRPETWTPWQQSVSQGNRAL